MVTVHVTRWPGSMGLGLYSRRGGTFHMPGAVLRLESDIAEVSSDSIGDVQAPGAAAIRIPGPPINRVSHKRYSGCK
jgi:hypothetical protein